MRNKRLKIIFVYAFKPQNLDVLILLIFIAVTTNLYYMNSNVHKCLDFVDNSVDRRKFSLKVAYETLKNLVRKLA